MSRTITIRRMTRADLGVGMRLKQAAGWNQTSLDWARFLALEPTGCLIAQVGDRAVGSVTSCRFGSVAWIGCLLVEPGYRRMGIGSCLMQSILAQVEAKGAASIRLDATSFGQPLYEKLGFEPQFRLFRFAGVPEMVGSRRADDVRPFQWSHWKQLIALDQHVTGADRTKLLKRLLTENAAGARVAMQRGRLQGFVLDRRGSKAWQIGPLIARDDVSGRQLLAEALTRHCRHAVYVDVPEDHGWARSVMQDANLKQSRDFVRMCRGQPQRELVAGLWAGSGPEKG